MPSYADLEPYGIAPDAADAYNARIEAGRIIALHSAGIPYEDFTRLEDGSVQTVLVDIHGLGREWDILDEFFSLVAYYSAVGTTMSWRAISPRARATFARLDLEKMLRELAELYEERSGRALYLGSVLEIPRDQFTELILVDVRDQVLDIVTKGDTALAYRKLADHLAQAKCATSVQIHEIMEDNGVPFGFLRNPPLTEYLQSYLDLNS